MSRKFLIALVITNCIMAPLWTIKMVIKIALQLQIEKKEQMLKARAVFEKSIKCGFPFKDL